MTYARRTALRIRAIQKLKMSESLNPCKVKQMKEINVYFKDFTDIIALYCTKTGQMLWCCLFMLTSTDATFC